MTAHLESDDVSAAAEAALAPAAVIVRDGGLLASAAARPRTTVFGDDAYPDVWSKAAALLEGMARNHPLVDGNKRLAWVAMRLFLVLNGSDVAVSSPQDGDEFVHPVAQGRLAPEAIVAQLRTWESAST